MADVELLLRDYGHEVSVQCPPITVAELEDHSEITAIDDRGVDDLMADYLQPQPDESEAPAKREGWSGVVAAVAAAILVVAGVVVVAGGNSGNVVTDPATTSLRPADAASSAGSAEPGPYRWSRVPHDEAVFGGADEQWMNSVTAGGPGLVAVGSVGTEWDLDAAVWTSADGLTWSRVPNDEAVFGGPSFQWMSSVTAGGPGLVAVGWTGNKWDEDADAAVWTSGDGITWSRVPHEESVFGGAEMTGVTAGGPGLVAVGEVESGGAAVWTSVDGISWSRVPHDEAVFGGAEEMSGVTVGGPGLVAVGSAAGRITVHEGEVDWEPLAAVWTSVDGVTWSRVPHDEAVFGGANVVQRLSSVTAGGPGLVAVGRENVGGGDDSVGSRAYDAAVWTSVDGVTWSRVPHEETVFGGTGSQAMYGVTMTDAGLVAVGHDGGYYDTRPNAAVWTSIDGFTWSRLDHDEAAFGGAAMRSVTVAGAGLVAVGDGLIEKGGGPGRGDSVFVWVAEPQN